LFIDPEDAAADVMASVAEAFLWASEGRRPVMHQEEGQNPGV
jgi:hypothetical protein